MAKHSLMSRAMGDYGPYDDDKPEFPKGSHWKYLEPTHLVGAFLSWVVLSIFWSIVALVASMALWGSLWGALVGPVVAMAQVYLSVGAAMKDRQRRWESAP